MIIGSLDPGCLGSSFEKCANLLISVLPLDMLNRESGLKLMPDVTPIRVDFTHTDAVLQVLPQAPVISSSGAGWRGIYLEHHRQPPYEMPEHCAHQHVIALYHNSKPVPVKRKLNEQFSLEYLIQGGIVIEPAGVLHQSSWQEEDEFTLLVLEPTLVARIAYELVDPNCVELVPHFLQPDPLIYQIGLALMAELKTNGHDSRLYAESMAKALAVHLIRRYASRKHSLQIMPRGLSKSKLQQVIDYINAHLDQDLGLVELAELVQMSPCYFATLFKRSLGISPHQYVIDRRIQKAQQSLTHSEQCLADIAQKVGFSDQTSFTRAFRKKVGVTPKQYRDKL